MSSNVILRRRFDTDIQTRTKVGMVQEALLTKYPQVFHSWLFMVRAPSRYSGAIPSVYGS